MQQEAKGFLVPGRTGSGSPTSERSIGFNVSAMDYSMAVDILPVLHRYEALIRRGRNLTPPALLRREPSTEAEVAATAQFHITHLGWTLKQDWVGEFAGEVKVIHSKGLSVTKSFIETTRRIPCPTDDCKNKVAIDIDNILGDVNCLKCKGSWTLYRLLQLAMHNPDKMFWLDLEAICLWLNITKKQALKEIDEHEIPKRNGLYDLASIIRIRNEVASF
jgi:predicted DNA-binding ribbon-helix-helix protein